MAYEIVRYVDPDVSLGGDSDGLTWATAYTSLFNCENLEQRDLTAGDSWMHIYCRSSGGTADTLGVVIVGWTTSATNYILIEAAPGDEAVKTSWDTSRYRLHVVDTSCLDIREDFVRVSGLQIFNDGNTSTAYGIVCQSIGSPSDLRINNCRIKGAGTSTKRGIYASDAQVDIQIWNCIIYSEKNDGILLNLNTVSVFNTIIYNCTTDGFELDGGAAVIENCVIFNNGDDFDIVGIATIDHCASDDGDGTNPIAPLDADWDNEFVDAANGDFSLKSGGNLFGAGIPDPGSGLFTTDIDGDTYFIPWNIGVDQLPKRTSLNVSTSSFNYRPFWSLGKTISPNTPIGDTGYNPIWSLGKSTITHNAPEIIHRYVNTTSEPGGSGYYDGDSSSYGANRSYSTMNEWEAAEDGVSISDLVDYNYIHVAHCNGDTDTTATVIKDWGSTGQYNYIKILTDQENRHAGIWDDTKYNLSVTDPTDGIIQVRESNVQIDGIQASIEGTADNCEGISFGDTIDTAIENVKISNSIIKNENTGDTEAGIRFFADTFAITNGQAWNNIIYGFNGTDSI